jgi:hypothetical protein
MTPHPRWFVLRHSCPMELLPLVYWAVELPHQAPRNHRMPRPPRRHLSQTFHLVPPLSFATLVFVLKLCICALHAARLLLYFPQTLYTCEAYPGDANTEDSSPGYPRAKRVSGAGKVQGVLRRLALNVKWKWTRRNVVEGILPETIPSNRPVCQGQVLGIWPFCQEDMSHKEIPCEVVPQVDDLGRTEDFPHKKSRE